jgi:hypothetical protein
MTANELEFFGRLVTALPGHYVFPQVAMSALIEAASSDKNKAHGDRLRIAQQRADYVVCYGGRRGRRSDRARRPHACAAKGSTSRLAAGTGWPSGQFVSSRATSPRLPQSISPFSARLSPFRQQQCNPKQLP